MPKLIEFIKLNEDNNMTLMVAVNVDAILCIEETECSKDIHGYDHPDYKAMQVRQKEHSELQREKERELFGQPVKLKHEIMRQWNLENPVPEKLKKEIVKYTRIRLSNGGGQNTVVNVENSVEDILKKIS